MISAVFVDRPRLAIVISVVLTIAGLLSLYVIPIAQYPDIVPPQVSVITTYPGANASVVDATVAQVRSWSATVPTSTGARNNLRRWRPAMRYPRSTNPVSSPWPVA
jgi:Cu/Ag efflux pump CusA